MRQAIMIISFVLFSVFDSLAQSIEDLTWLNIYSKDSFQLFDSNTIKKRNIKKAFVVRISKEADRKGRWLVNDTCYVYEFNEMGRAIRRINFYNHQVDDFSWSDTFLLPLTHHSYLTQGIHNRTTKTIPLPVGKLVTEYLVWKNENILDTSFTIKTKYNLQNQKIEEEVIPSKFYLKSLDCLEGTPPYHYKYGYDKKGRLNRYRDCFSKEYISISYPSYGELIKRFNASNNQLLSQEVNTISIEDDANSLTTTITTKESQVVIARHKNQDKLIGLISIIKNSSFPEIKYLQITYK